MNKRLKIILIIAVILILLGMKNVFAANGSFSINKNSVAIKVGETTTFSITATNCAGKFTVTSSNTSVATVSTNSEWIENTSKEITITAKSAGTTTITIKADDVASTDEDEVTGSKTIQVTVSEKATNNNNNNSNSGGTNNTQTSATKSTEAKLKTLGIRPNDFSGFSKDRNKENWSVEVPNNVSEVEVYATAVSDKAKVEGTGKVSLKEGNNTVKIKVTAEAGNTKTYTLTIKRKTSAEETQNAGEARLKTLGIKPEQYDFTGFKSDTMEYSVEVPNEVNEVEVYATAINSNAQITGTGMITLKEGENALKIEVMAEDGTQKTYTLNVTRKETDAVSGTNEDKLGLSELSIEGIDINPSFKSSIYEYTATITKVMVGDSLNITAKANDETATVEIIGNENLQDGENIITILVKNDATNENATYQITVNKQVEAEIIEKTSWLKPSTWGKEEKIKVAIIVVLIILIISAIILKVKIGKENNSNEEREFPGAEELDKAIAEHQELSTEEDENVMTDNLEDGIKSESELNYIQEIAESRFENEENKEEFQEVKTKRKGRHF